MEWIVALIALMWLAYVLSTVRKRRREAERVAVYLDKARAFKKKSEEAPRAPAKLKRLDEAIAQLHKVLEARPRNPTAKELLAQYKAEREALTAQAANETTGGDA